MDFIKTSSLRALIELTFQRNWNGLIWMSRKGVITKRVKTVQTALSRISAQPRSGWPRNECSRSAKSIRPSEVSAKVPTIGRYASRPGKAMSRGRPRHATHMPRTTMPREPGSNASRPRNLSRTTADAPSEPGKHVPRPAEKHRPTSSVRPQRPTTNPSGHDRSDRRGHDPMSGRSSRPTVRTPRSTRSPF
ncbi:unnamed protein product [Microthlaspi erraticum]|uniref:Uncharacterized protein n=1 Tax=Microthlaspi erraticum TaxID=1685480 RepID=A0A6D2KB08_9BRAS|nr:unnamed protein product [Microthlaspi erraticum]